MEISSAVLITIVQIIHSSFFIFYVVFAVLMLAVSILIIWALPCAVMFRPFRA
jgi:hypothetical protein